MNEIIMKIIKNKLYKSKKNIKYNKVVSDLGDLLFPHDYISRVANINPSSDLYFVHYIIVPLQRHC